jgi:hypothetical protein
MISRKLSGCTQTLTRPIYLPRNIYYSTTKEKVKIQVTGRAQAKKPGQVKHTNIIDEPYELPTESKTIIEKLKSLFWSHEEQAYEKAPINLAVYANYKRFHDKFRKLVPSFLAASFFVGLFAVIWRGNNDEEAISEIKHKLALILSPEQDFLQHGYASPEEFLIEQTKLLRSIDYIVQNPYNWAALAECDIIEALTYVLKSDTNSDHIIYATHALVRLLDAQAFRPSIEQHLPASELAVLIKSIKQDTEPRGELCNLLVQYFEKSNDKAQLCTTELMSVTMSMLQDPTFQARRVSSQLVRIMMESKVENPHLEQLAASLVLQFPTVEKRLTIYDLVIRENVYHIMEEYVKQKNDPNIKFEFENESVSLIKLVKLDYLNNNIVGNFLLVPMLYSMVRNYVRFNKLGISGPILLLRYTLPTLKYAPLVMAPVVAWELYNEHYIKKKYFYQSEELPKKETVPLYPLMRYGPELLWLMIANLRYPFLILPYMHAVIMGSEMRHVNVSTYFLGYSQSYEHEFQKSFVLRQIDKLSQ